MATVQIVSLFLMAALGLAENSGIIFVQRFTSAGQSSVVITEIDHGKLRRESYTGSMRVLQLYDSTERALRTLDLYKKTYSVQTAAADFRNSPIAKYEFRRLGAGRAG